MLDRLADLGIRAPKRVLSVAGLLLVLAAIFGAPVAAHLGSGGFSDPDSQSQRAVRTLAGTFDAGDLNLVLTVRSAAGADSPAATRIGRNLVARLDRAQHVSQVTSYWSAPANESSALRSSDQKTGLVVARVEGTDSQSPTRAAEIVAPLTGTRDGVEVKAGGQAFAFHEVNENVKDDLTASELIAIPLTTIVLIIVFGGLFASLLPVALGISAIVGTLAILRGLATVTDVSIFALNMTTALGLALAIDYSLFVVSRYREEIRAGRDPDDAVRRTMQTAGRTVLFSALTVGLSLAAMLVFPLYFLRSFAYAGVAVVLFATVGALVLLPAVLTLIGTRIDALDLRVGLRRVLGRPEPAPKAVEDGAWYRFARVVMKRALPIGVLVTALLVGIGLPFLNAEFGYPDDRVLPPTASAHQVGDQLRDNFSANTAGTITVLGSRVGDAAGLADYARTLSGLDHVTSVGSGAGTFVDGAQAGPADPAMTRTTIAGTSTYLQVRTDTDPQTDTARTVLALVRDVPAPFATQFAGQTAENADSLDALASSLPWALLLIAVATFIVLFLFTGSLLLPIKALVLNTLSLTATFGAMVWIFQDGHLHWLFPDLTVTGRLGATMPPLMFCLAFGLSMDYEVFLLSRIREEWLATGDNERAVAAGLGRTGRIVSLAAVLMAIVFAAIATSGVSFIALFGTGLTLAVLMDATVVRGILVPAFMRLAGRWNWWAPAPLARLHARIGLHEGPPALDPTRELTHA